MMTFFFNTIGGAIGHNPWIAVNSTEAGGAGASWQNEGRSSGSQSQAPPNRGGFGNWSAPDEESGGPGTPAAGAAASSASKSVPVSI